MRKVGNILNMLRNGEQAPTRHHNPYLLESLSLTEHLITLENNKEKYHSIFPDMEKPLIVEIGCYMGKTLMELAIENEDINFLGLDITYKRVVKAARKLKKNSFTNAKIAMCDGKNFLKDIVPMNSLHGVCVFFPDPWPKDRHEKNRLLSKEFVEILFSKLQQNGFFWFKTDHEQYFRNGHEILTSLGFEPLNKNEEHIFLQPETIQGGPYETAFQLIFKNKGIPFFQNIYLKTIKG